MIGTSAFLIRLGAIVVGLFLVSIGTAILIKTRRAAVLLFLGFGAIFLFVGVVSFVNQVSSHSFLAGLSAKDIAGFQVGKNPVTRPEHVELLMEALQNKKWFASNHGGWAKEEYMVIVFKTGEKRYFKVGYYLRREGAVVGFYYRTRGLRMGVVRVFCPKLPKALSEIGIPLPSKLEAESRDRNVE